MNKYIIPVCDLVEATNCIKTYSARSIVDCQERIMIEFSNNYDEDFYDYNEFLNIMDTKYNIAIGEIIDIETI